MGRTLLALTGLTLASCAGNPVLQSQSRAPDSLGGERCALGGEATQLFWVVTTDREAPQARLFLQPAGALAPFDADLDGVPVKIDDRDLHQPVHMAAMVPFQFTLYMGPLPARSGKLRIALWYKEAPGKDPMFVRDSWCELKR